MSWEANLKIESLCRSLTVFRSRRTVEILAYWPSKMFNVSGMVSKGTINNFFGSMMHSIKVIFWTNGAFSMKEKGRDGEGRKENEG